MKKIFFILCSMHLFFVSFSFSNQRKLLTTTIGSYPKPSYVNLPDWFQSRNLNYPYPSQAYYVNLLDWFQSRNLNYPYPSQPYDEYAKHPDKIEVLDRATQEVVKQQVKLGIDVPTDGEIRREHYIYYQCRHITGIDFNTLTKKEMREGAWVGYVPTVTGPISAQPPFLPRDFLIAQQATDRPVKITIPGPMTIMDTIADNYYLNEEALGLALAHAINQEVLALVDAGCKWIQIDEPLFARHPNKALRFGIQHVEKCFANVPDTVKKVIHICCGYPEYLDQEGYLKGNPQSYVMLAPALDNSVINAISLEDTHQRNNPELFLLFKNKTIILGVIDIARSPVESVAEIEHHIRDVLQYIDAERLIIAPDCGLGMLPNDILCQKLHNMHQAVSHLNASS